MCNRTITLCVSLAFVSLAGCGGDTTALTDDEDRPPIIVKGGSIEFESAEGWEERGTGGLRWRQVAKAGKNIKGFRAEVRDRSGNVVCEVPAEANPLRVEYEETTDTTTETIEFRLMDAGVNVDLDSPVILTASGITLLYGEPGRPVSVGHTSGKPCPIGTGETVRVIAQLN